MSRDLEILAENRKALIGLVKHLTEEQFNLIPPGHNNNVIWNMGHILAVSESLLYKNSGFRPPNHDFDIKQFGRETKPEHFFGQVDIFKIIEALLQTVAVFKKTTNIMDVINLDATDENHVVTGQALQFLLFHEDLHYRTIGALLKRL